MHTRQYPLLLTLINSEHAKWYCVTADQVEFLDELIEPHDRYSDNEGFFASSAPGLTYQSGGPDHGGMVDVQHMRNHLRHAAERTKELWSEETYKQLICAIPDEEKNHCRTEMARVLPQTDMHGIAGNFMHASPDEIRALVEKHFQLPE